MTRPTTRPLVLERFCQQPGVRLVIRGSIWVMAGVYAYEAVLDYLAPLQTSREYRLGVIRETALHFSFIASLFFWHHFFASYSARQASPALWRKDAIIGSLLGVIVFSLGTPWPWGGLTSLLLCSIIYFLEVSKIRRLERERANGPHISK